MQFRMLGPLEVADGERAVPIATGKQAALLADLLLHANRAVPTSQLVDDLWAEDAPDRAVKAVQVYVSQLRKKLADGRLQTRGTGYLLDVREGELDLEVFAKLAADGRSALGADDRRAAELLAEALALWRGPALSGLNAPFVPIEAARLDELRLACHEDRLEAFLGLGRHQELVPELEATVARHPLRERPRTLLMLALYRAGRQADALAAYAAFRQHLADELGIEPSAELRELERRILNQDASLAVSSRVPTEAGDEPASVGSPSVTRLTGLLERDGALDHLDAALARARAGSGHAVLVVGEAGVGKSALVDGWKHAIGSGARVLSGACDPLLTPRALGPFRDIATQAGGRILEAVEAGAGRDAVLDALLVDLAEATTILVVEDVHWADEATLDVLAVLGRRLSGLPALLVATTRPEGLASGHGLLGAFGELPPSRLLRIDLEPLSPAGVEELAHVAGMASEGLHETTGGNPFFVTEVLAGGGTSLPQTVRAAVLARCGRLSTSARRVIDAVSVVPGRAELTLVQEIVDPSSADIEECLASGILASDGRTLRFRHEIARLAVESELSPPRRAELESAVLVSLEAQDGHDLARAVHHARLAGDGDAVRRLAPAAARQAAKAGAHREAAAHYRAALALADDLGDEERAELLECLSVEAYLADSVEDALAARREAVDLRREQGNALRLGDGLRWLARLLWWSLDGEAARRTAAEAVDVLEAVGPSRELAMALSSLSQLDMLAWRPEESIRLAERARELARSVGDEETAVHALTNIGISLRLSGDWAGGRAALEEAFTTAAEAGFEDHAGRALAGLASTSMELRDARLVEADLERGVRYLDGHNLDGYLRYMLGMRAQWRVDRGDLAGAEADALDSLRGGSRTGVSGHNGRVALARVQMRRGDRDAEGTLQEALRLARRSGEVQRLGPTTAALAEWGWLTGRLDSVLDDVQEAYDAALGVTADWILGELGFWLWRGGRLERAHELAAEPYRLLLEGRWREAAAAWDEIGLPYWRAETLVHGDTREAREEALAFFEQADAPAAAAAARRWWAQHAGTTTGPGVAARRTEPRVLATAMITDVVDSTSTLSRIGDSRWAELIAQHDAVVREELVRHGGTEVNTTGDGFLALFETSAPAIRCAIAITRRVGGLGLGVRVGIHTGEIEQREGEVRGIAVHLTARIAARADAGEVLVSSTTRDLAAGAGLVFTDRGKHELKGIDRPRRLFAAAEGDLDVH